MHLSTGSSNWWVPSPAPSIIRRTQVRCCSTLVSGTYIWCWKLRGWILIMTSSNGNIFRVTDPLCGEFTGLQQRPVTRSFDVFFDLRLDGRLSKHSWGWWLETPSCPLWSQSNDYLNILQRIMNKIKPLHNKSEILFIVSNWYLYLVCADWVIHFT